MEEELIEQFQPYRTGDVVFSAGQGLGDLIIFFGRHSTIQHSALLVWLDKAEADKGNIKVVPYYVDENTTILTFLGLAEGRKMDIVKKEKHKGMILYQPAELFKNAPIIYIRALEQKYISDEYVCQKMQEYIQIHHLKTQYAYGKLYIVTTGLGFDVLGKHKSGILCSENIYNFLNYLCDYPNFKLEDVFHENQIRVKGVDNSYVPEHKEYIVPDAKDYMTLPDFFASENNSHPVFEEKEFRVIARKSEVEVTVWHPYFITFVVLVIIILFVFFVINNFCESCRGNGFCMRPSR